MNKLFPFNKQTQHTKFKCTSSCKYIIQKLAKDNRYVLFIKYSYGNQSCTEKFYVNI